MNISMEYYKIFYKVALHGSVTKAAKELCLSQPAVSQAIKVLENMLGAVLFIRKSKGVVLTTEGNMLFEYVARGYEQIKLGEEKINQMLNLDVGEIRIGASDMTLQFYLLPYLERFHSMHPNIKVHVTNAPTPLTMEHLLAGRIDFGVVSTPFDFGNRFRVYEGRKIRDVFVAGSRFLNLKDKVLEYDVLQNYPIISLEHKTSTRRYVDWFLMQNGVVLNPEFELATSAIVTQFAVRNLGIGCVVEDFAKEEIENGTIFRLDFKKEIPERSICIITDDKVPMSKAATTFLSLVGGLEIDSSNCMI